MKIILTEEQKQESIINEIVLNKVKSFLGIVDNKEIKTINNELNNLLFSLNNIKNDLKKWDVKSL